MKKFNRIGHNFYFFFFFFCYLFRSILHFNYRSQAHIPHEIRLIAKIPPKSSYRRQMYNSARHFAREHYIYECLFPEFEKFQRLHMKKQYIFKHYPRLVTASSVYEDEFVLLTDLSLQGFENSDRPTPLDFDKCVAVLKTIAKFHAISFAMKDQQPEKLAKLTNKMSEIMFTKPINKSFENFLKKNVEYSMTTLDPEMDKVIIKKLLEFRENYASFMAECCAEQEDAIVLHGDCWISNMMFRPNEVSVVHNLKFFVFENVCVCVCGRVDRLHSLRCSMHTFERNMMVTVIFFFFISLL